MKYHFAVILQFETWYFYMEGYFLGARGFSKFSSNTLKVVYEYNSLAQEELWKSAIKIHFQDTFLFVY